MNGELIKIPDTMSHPFEQRYGKKQSESYNDFHMPDQFIVSNDAKDQVDLGMDCFSVHNIVDFKNALNNGVRKNIIIQQGQHIGLDPMKLKQMKEQQQLMTMMT